MTSVHTKQCNKLYSKLQKLMHGVGYIPDDTMYGLRYNPEYHKLFGRKVSDYTNHALRNITRYYMNYNLLLAVGLKTKIANIDNTVLDYNVN